jgi:hypothetical protein
MGEWLKSTLTKIITAIAIMTAGWQGSIAKDFNQYVLEVLKEYPTDGTHAYDWPKPSQGKDPYDGCTMDIYYQGQKILRGNGKGSTFCCGLTLEVFLKASERYLSRNQKTPLPAATDTTRDGFQLTQDIGNLNAGNFDEFKKQWFCVAVHSPGPGDALQTFGLGTVITDWKKAKAGDFVQIWRNNGSGHSVIFIEWVYGPQKEIKGIKYWSTQTKTGIAYATEYFGTTGRTIDRLNTFISRATYPVK